MTSFAWYRLATVTASTLRPPTLSGGKRGAPATYLEELLVTPLEPIDADLREKLPLSAPHELLQCFTVGSNDVREGDTLVISSKKYPIEAVADFPWRGTETYRQLVIRDQKTV